MPPPSAAEQAAAVMDDGSTFLLLRLLRTDVGDVVLTHLNGLRELLVLREVSTECMAFCSRPAALSLHGLPHVLKLKWWSKPPTLDDFVRSCSRILGPVCRRLVLNVGDWSTPLAFLETARNLVELELCVMGGGSVEADTRQLLQICSHLPKLRKLRNVFVARPLVGAARELSMLCPLLETIEWGGDRGVLEEGDESAWASHFPNLTSLDVPVTPMVRGISNDPVRVHVPALLEVARACPRIEQFTVHRNLSDEAAASILSKAPENFFKRIRVLAFDFCTVSSRSLLAIVRDCSALESLDLYLASFEQGLFEEIAATHPSLKTLVLHDPDSKTLTDSLLQGGFANPIMAFSGLHNLSLTQCEGLSDVSLRNIAASPTRTTLIKLDLSWCFFDLTAVEDLIDACPNLIELIYHQYDFGGDDEESKEWEADWERIFARLGVLMKCRGGSFDGHLQ